MCVEGKNIVGAGLVQGALAGQRREPAAPVSSWGQAPEQAPEGGGREGSWGHSSALWVRMGASRGGR